MTFLGSEQRRIHFRFSVEDQRKNLLSCVVYVDENMFTVVFLHKCAIKVLSALAENYVASFGKNVGSHPITGFKIFDISCRGSVSNFVFI